MSDTKSDPRPEALTKTQLARALGVKVRTVNRWLKREEPCPATKVGGQHLFDLQRVKEWREAAGAAEPAPATTALAKAEIVRKVTQARRHEMELAAERGLKDLGLGDQIRAAKTHDDLGEISKEIGALLGSGLLSPARGRAIQVLLAEARHNLKAHRESEADEEPQRLILLTLEGGQLVRNFEKIVSDARRAEILAHVASELEIDGLEYPDVDLTEATREGPDPDMEP